MTEGNEQLRVCAGLVDGTLPLNTMAETLSYDVTEVVVGRLVVTAEPSSRHLNPAGTVQRWSSRKLLDSCMGLAIRSNARHEVSRVGPTAGTSTFLLFIAAPSVGPHRAHIALNFKTNWIEQLRPIFTSWRYLTA